ncbi:DUF4919 domain-containing protein [Winogradskyella sp.]|uniref:DUF4919 domain-containing protein n=1 Tax=Winogradskyella sp. TaxID=1883156 RepID=UPI003BABBEAE
MKTYFLQLCLLLVSFSFYAQQNIIGKPNYKKIKKSIQKENGDFYYPALMERFKAGDSTMNIDEKRHLYYGFINEDLYSPYGRSDYSDSLREVLKKPNHNDGDLDEIEKFSDSILVEKPFSFKAMNYKLYVFDTKKDTLNFNKTIDKVNIVLDAIFSSGDGKKKESAFYVIETSHEYFILEVLGFQFGGTQRLIEHYDYLEIAENESGIEGLYFDVSPCLQSLSNTFGD